WPLQCNRFVYRTLKPRVDFLLCGQNHRHCLGMDRAHGIVRFGRQKREEPMLAALAPSLAGPQPPNPGKGEERTAFVEREPMRHLWPAIRPLAKGRCRDKTAPFGCEPAAPIG